MTMGMTSLSIILTVFVLQLHHVGPHQRRVPKWLQSFSYDILATVLGLKPKQHPFQYHSARTHLNNVSFSPFVDTIDSNNCNGVIIHRPTNHRQPALNTNITSQVTSQRTRNPQVQNQYENRYNGNKVDADMAETQDRITNSLKILVEKQDLEERHQDIVNEWRFVALVMDRFLFWLFLLAAFMSSIIILVIIPQYKPKID